MPMLFGPEYLALPRSTTPWLIQSLIPRKGFTLMHAPPKQGKTTAVLQCAEALSNPDHHAFFGLGIHEHGPVGILQLDTPADLWRSEYVSVMHTAGLGFGQVCFHDRETIPKGLYPFNILNPLHHQWLSKEVAAMGLIALVVDSYRACFLGDEDKSDKATQVIQALQSALDGAALILIHHNKKPGQQNGPQNDEGRVEEIRGSGALAGLADTIWRVKRKRWSIVGRGGEAAIEVVYDRETHMVTAKTIITDQLIDALYLDPKFTSERQIALHLADLSGLPLETIRSRLRRRKSG